MKFVSKAVLVTLLGFSFISAVSAKSIYYTNENGVEMTRAEYEKMVDIFSERKTRNLTQDEFDKYNEKEIADSSAVYQKVTYEDGEVIKEEEISEEEFNNAKEFENSCTPYSDTDQAHETAYKRLSAYLYTDNSVLAILTWKKVPYVRSYDVFGMRFQYFNYTSFQGAQDYYVGTKRTRINYDMSSPGFKAQSTGWGVSMNLKDGLDITGYDMIVETQLQVQNTNSTLAHAYISYQHAQADLTREQSMSYSMSISGLGSVFYYSNASIRDTYDDMTGLHLLRHLS
ncbi:MAG TPA: hypothetical protein DCY94_04280 [Firmicutes bacterium]|nr:hypothetical protein [Bacillota bacterium]